MTAMADKSKERQQADAAFEAATSQSRELRTAEVQPVADNTSKLKELRLERERLIAEALKRKRS